MKKLIVLLLIVCLTATVFAACGEEVVASGTTSLVETDETTAPEKSDATATTEAKSTEPLLSKDDVPAADLSSIDTDYQTAAPKAGDLVGVIHTNYGDIKLRFFPEVAPMAVYNFKALADAGRYDNTIFHRIATVATSGCDVIQAGDYTNFNGTGGVSAFGEGFGYEICDYTLNIRGSVAMAHSSMPDSNGSQFYINMSNNNALDGDYTVFAQVYEGIDVADAIFAVPANNQVPTEQIVITSVEVFEYSE